MAVLDLSRLGRNVDVIETEWVPTYDNERLLQQESGWIHYKIGFGLWMATYP